MQDIITVDGIAYAVNVISLKRDFSVLDGDNAGRTLDARMNRDIKGTFYNYTLIIAADKSFIKDYDTLYEVLSAPVDYHQILLPYAQSILAFEAYVANGSDDLVRKSGGVNYWGPLSISFIAMEPARYPA